MRSPTDQMPALLIQPPRLVDVPTSGETVTTRSATSGASRTRSTKKRPNACCVDSDPLCSRPRSSGAPGRRAQRRLRARGVQRGPWVVRVRAQRAGELRVLLRVEQGAVVGGMALRRQHPALDGVGEHDGGAARLGVGLAVGVDVRAEVMATEIAEGGEEITVLQAGHVDLQALAQLARV